MAVLIVLTASPYGTDIVYNALRLAAALQTEATVRIFLMSDAVGVAIAGQSGANEDGNLGSRLERLVRDGAEVRVCGLCLETRGYHNAPRIDGVGIGTIADLARWTVESDRALTF